MGLVELLVFIIGIPTILLMAWAVDRKKNDYSDFFTLDDDDF